MLRQGTLNAIAKSPAVDDVVGNRIGRRSDENSSDGGRRGCNPIFPLVASSECIVGCCCNGIVVCVAAAAAAAVCFVVHRKRCYCVEALAWCDDGAGC